VCFGPKGDDYRPLKPLWSIKYMKQFLTPLSKTQINLPFENAEDHRFKVNLNYLHPLVGDGGSRYDYAHFK
jgi:hypothetical protein